MTVEQQKASGKVRHIGVTLAGVVSFTIDLRP